MIVELTEQDLAAIKHAAFVVETVAHLKGQEMELLPTADHLRALIHKVETEGKPV